MRRAASLIFAAALPFLAAAGNASDSPSGLTQNESTSLQAPVADKLNQLNRIYTFAQSESGRIRLEAMEEIFSDLLHITKTSPAGIRQRAYQIVVGTERDDAEAIFLGRLAETYILEGQKTADSSLMFSADTALRAISNSIERANDKENKKQQQRINEIDYSETAKAVYAYIQHEQFNSPEKFTAVWSEVTLQEAQNFLEQAIDQRSQEGFNLMQEAERSLNHWPSAFLLPFADYEHPKKADTYTSLTHPTTGMPMTKESFTEILQAKALEAAQDVYRKSHPLKGEARYEALKSTAYLLSEAGYANAANDGHGLQYLSNSKKSPDLASFRKELETSAIEAAIDVYNRFVKPYLSSWREIAAKNYNFISNLEGNISIVMKWISRAANARGQGIYGINDLNLPETDLKEIKSIGAAYRQKFGNSISVPMKPSAPDLTP